MSVEVNESPAATVDEVEPVANQTRNTRTADEPTEQRAPRTHTIITDSVDNPNCILRHC